MPRSSVALTREPLTADLLAAAVDAVRSHADADALPFELRVVDEGAMLQIVAADLPVLSVVRPRLLPTLDEVARLLPTADVPPSTRWWADAYTPWRPDGAIGVEILDAVVAASGGLMVHQGLGFMHCGR